MAGPNTQRSGKSPATRKRNQRILLTERVAALTGIPPSNSPFAGIADTKTPAKSTKTPALTDKVTLARAARERLLNGGLLPSDTPPPRIPLRSTPAVTTKTEKKAVARIADSAPLVEPRPPVPGSLIVQAARKPTAGSATTTGAPVNPRLGMLIAAQRNQGKSHGIDWGSVVNLGSDHSWADALTNVYQLADKGIGTAAETWLRSQSSTGGPIAAPIFRPPPGVKVASSQQALSDLYRTGLKAPDVRIPISDIHFDSPEAQAAYAKHGADASVPFSDLMNSTGWGLTPEAAKRYAKTAHDVQGWNYSDLEGLSGTDTIFRAYNKPPNLIARIGMGIAGDVIQGGSMTVGALGLLSEAAHGRGMQAAKDYVDAVKSTTPGLANHPAGDVALTHPLFAYAAAHGALKTAGSVGHLRPGTPGERIVHLAGQAEGTPPINRGRYSKNLTTAAKEGISDLRASHSTHAANKLIAKEFDRNVILSRDRATAGDVKVQVAHRAALVDIPKKRAVQLMAWTDFGGAPGVRNAIEHYTRQAKEGNQAAARHLPNLETVLAHPPEGPKEQAYVESLRAIAEHTSNVRKEKGLHGDLAQEYRRWESPIEMAAALGDATALRAKEARQRFEDIRQKDPTAASAALNAKVGEVTRDVKRHAKKESPTLEEWRAQGKALDARKPKLRKGASDRQRAEHADAMRLWRNEKARHVRLGGRIAAHATEVRQQSRRLDRLTAKQRDALPYDEQVTLARDEYQKAVADFAAQHRAAGGAEPAYIERSQPKSRAPHPSRTSGLVRVTTKVPREHFSSGETVRRGEFAYDVRSPLRASAEARRIAQHIELWNQVATNPMVHFIVGDGETTRVGKGQVAVTPQNFRNLADTHPAWQGLPISIHDIEAEHSVRRRIYESLSGSSLQEGDIIPRGTEVAIMPKALNDRIVEWAKPRSRDGVVGKYDRANAIYQQLLIGLYPSTWLGNAPGSLVGLAIPSGAIPGRGAFSLANRSGPTRGVVSRAIGYEKDPALAPRSIQGLGPAGMSHVDPSRNPLLRVAAYGRELSMKGEDNAARAAYFGQVKPAVEGWLPRTRKLFPAVERAMPGRWKGLAKQLNMDATDLYHALARGALENGKDLPPEMQALRDRAIDHTMEFMSDSSKPRGDLARISGRVILFSPWLGHILTLTLVSLPVNHPRRAMLMNGLAVYGNQYRQEHGVYPSWMTQFLPFLAGGQNGYPGMYSAGLGQLTPLSSATNLATAGTQFATSDPRDLALNLMSPLLQAAASPLVQAGKNNTNKPYEPDYSVGKVALGSALNTIPGFRKFAVGTGGGSGYEPGSNPITGMKKRHYYEYVQNPSGKGYKRYEIPWEMRPGGRPLTGLLGVLSRVIGLPVYWSPTGGVPLNVEQGNSQVINAVREVQRELKGAKP